MKSSNGPSGPIAIPAHIRAAQRDLGDEDRAYIRGKLGRALGKFSGYIVRVSVRTDDENGPRGGIDRVCRIKVVLVGLPSVVFEKRDAALNAAVDGALAGIEQAVCRIVQRRRMRGRRGQWGVPGRGAGPAGLAFAAESAIFPAPRSARSSSSLV